LGVRLDSSPIFLMALKLTSLIWTEIRFAAVGIAWKALDSEDNVMIQAGDIKYCQWLRYVALVE
jgi:hypothetical protein